MTTEIKSPAGWTSTTGPIERPTTNEKRMADAPATVNGQPPISWSPLAVAQATIPDLFTLAAELRWPIEAPGQNFAWYRGNSVTPSLSIAEDGVRWYDHVLGKGGGPIELLAVVEKLARPAAYRRFMEIAATIQSRMTHKQRVSVFSGGRVPMRKADQLKQAARDEAETVQRRADWLALYPLTTPTDQDFSRVIRSRGWPMAAAAGLKHAATIGILFRPVTYRTPAFAVTDESRLSAKIRPLDGGELMPGCKTRAMPGSVSSWPIGTTLVRPDSHVILCEGETDQLAMISLMAMFSPGALVRTAVVSLSAGSSIHCKAISQLKQARQVIIIADEDSAGRAAVVRWTEQLAAAGIQARDASVLGVADGVKDISDLLSKLNQFPELRECLARWVQSITGARDDHDRQHSPNPN